MSNNIVEVKNLTKSFSNNGSEVRALNGLSLDISYGDMLGIVGVSGSGKSTLLHIIGTLEKPTDGKVFLEGEDLFDHSDDELSSVRNSKIGFVFQFHYLMNEFDAKENVMLPCLIKGMDKNKAREYSEMILEKVGLKDRMNHKPGEMSGGEQQRVAIARAMVLKPKILLADEPTGNLDHKTGESIINLFSILNEEDDITSVIVTHNSSIADTMKRTITLLDGTIVDVN